MCVCMWRMQEYVLQHDGKKKHVHLTFLVMKMSRCNYIRQTITNLQQPLTTLFDGN